MLDLVADIATVINLTLCNRIAFRFNWVLEEKKIFVPTERKHVFRFFFFHFIIKRVADKEIWRAVHLLLEYI